MSIDRHKSTPPLVAVTATTRVVDGAARVRLTAAYVSALERAGLAPLVIPPIDPGLAPRILDAVSGLVLTGGEDVGPALYGASPHPLTGKPHQDRDAIEIALLHAAREREMPTLAICRGIQLVNVALGGTLVQDIPSERPGNVDHNPKGDRSARTHRVQVDADSRIARALGVTTLEVNSFHHQAVDRPAASLRVVGRADDGIIEAMESAADDPWALLAVEWHPEELVEGAPEWDRSLFRAFAELAAAYAPAASSAPASARTRS